MTRLEFHTSTLWREASIEVAIVLFGGRAWYLHVRACRCVRADTRTFRAPTPSTPYKYHTIEYFAFALSQRERAMSYGMDPGGLV